MELKEIPNTVVHCKTKDEYTRLMKIYEQAGWRWSFGQKKAPELASSVCDQDGGTYVEVNNYFARNHRAILSERSISFAEFLEVEGISEVAPIPQNGPIKFAVYKQEGVDIQLWVRDGIAEIHKRGTKRKSSFTVIGDTDQWVEIFFQGYCSAK